MWRAQSIHSVTFAVRLIEVPVPVRALTRVCRRSAASSASSDASLIPHCCNAVARSNGSTAARSRATSLGIV